MNCSSSLNKIIITFAWTPSVTIVTIDHRFYLDKLNLKEPKKPPLSDATVVGVKRGIKLFSSLLDFLGAQIPWKTDTYLNVSPASDNHPHLHHDHMLPTWTYGWCTPSCWSSRPHHCRGWQEPPDVWQLVTDSSLAAVSPNLEFLNFPIAKKSLHKMVILTSTRCIRRLWLDSGCWIGIKDINHLLIPINVGLLAPSGALVVIMG